jgi:hypothetical protein
MLLKGAGRFVLANNLTATPVSETTQLMLGLSISADVAQFTNSERC